MKFLRQWNEWLKGTHYKGFVIKMLNPLVKDGFDISAYFIIEDKGFAWEFKLGRDKRKPDNLNGDFDSDYSGGCYTGEHCQWKSMAEDYVIDHYEEGLGKVLDGLGELFRQTINDEFAADGPTFPAPKTYKSKAIVSIYDYEREGMSIRQLGNDIIHVSVGKIVMHCKIHAAHKSTTAEVEILEPRIKDGNGVDFGGILRSKYLKAESVQEVLDNIYNLAKIQAIDYEYYHPYEQEERDACKVKNELPEGEYDVNKMVLTMLNDDIDTDSIAVHPEFFNKYIGMSPWLTVSLTSNVNVTGYYKCYPDKKLSGMHHIGMSYQVAANLVVELKDTLICAIAELSFPSEIILRIKEPFGKLTGSLPDTIENMVLTTGHRYIITMGEHQVVMDVIENSNGRACHLFMGLEGEKDVEIIMRPTLTILRPDPLEPEFASDETESESESESD